MLRNITTKELQALIGSDEKFKLVNVLAESRFEAEHICGSINIPLKNVEGDAGKYLNKNERIIVHCSGVGCTASEDACDRLLKLGYRNIERYAGGMEEWKRSGGCIEGSGYEKAA